MRTFAIDPGTTQSAYVLFNPGSEQRPLVHFGILPNQELESLISGFDWCPGDCCVLEMVASYGMPVGRDVFETVFWTGRFARAWDEIAHPASERLYRREVKLHLCDDSRAKDANIRQALIDRFGPGKEVAVGKKATPGPLYGVSKDVWAALAVAVTFTDRHSTVPAF